MFFIRYRKGDPEIAMRIDSARRGERAMPIIIVYELEYERSKSKFPARCSGEKRGSTIGPVDMLIAGTAVSRSAALVTNNAAEFSCVPGLRVLDWKSA